MYGGPMPTLPVLASFAAASLALLVIPGPAVIYIVNRSVADGRRVGVVSVLGVELGSLVHVVAAALGLSALLAASATAFTAVKWFGAAYLVYLGVRTLSRAPGAIGSVAAVSARTAFRQGAIVQILNPKVALFFLSFLPQFVNPDRGGTVLQATMLGLVFVVLATASDMAYALTASAIRGPLMRSAALPFFQRYVAGSVYVALGVLAAATGQRTRRSAA